MSSLALVGLLEALEEIADLESANPTPAGAVPRRPQITRVIGRASVVLLSSHFERYIYRVNEEVATFLAQDGVSGDSLPEPIRLLHSKKAIDDLASLDWQKRTQQLKSFVSTDLWLWRDGTTGELDHKRLLAWMKAPMPQHLVRYYRYWEIPDIFSAITRRPSTRADLWLRIRSLVEKRNNIAHGDSNEQATQKDVRQFTLAIRIFCERSDAKLAWQVRKLFGGSKPW
jgi:hypothetical protein